MSVFRDEDPFVTSLELRVHEVVGLPRDHGYHSQLLEYQAGASYHLHSDCGQSADPALVIHHNPR